jgi:branched-chain amino acid transport system substrate-binding protein
LLRLTFIVIFTVVAIFGCGKKNEKTDVGFIGTISGRYSDLGQATLQGVMLAIESYGASENINLVVKDDFGKPADGARIISEFAEDNVRYVIGPSISSVATAVVPMLGAANVRMLSPTVSTSSLAGKKDNFARIMPHNSFKQAGVISTYLLNKLDIKDIVILYDSRNSSYSNDIVKQFAEAYMAKGGSIRDVRSFNPDSGQSLSTLLDDDRDNPPAMYYVIGSAMDTSLIIWQIKKAGMKSRVLIRKWAASSDFYRLGGEAVEGVMLFDYYIDTNTEQYKVFAKAYKKKFMAEPSWMGVYGYEAARILLNALDEVKSGMNFNAALTKAAENNEILKNMEFDEYGDAYLPLHYFVIENGETVYKGLAE